MFEINDSMIMVVFVGLLPAIYKGEHEDGNHYIIEWKRPTKEEYFENVNNPAEDTYLVETALMEKLWCAPSEEELRTQVISYFLVNAAEELSDVNYLQMKQLKIDEYSEILANKYAEGFKKAQELIEFNGE